VVLASTWFEGGELVLKLRSVVCHISPHCPNRAVWSCWTHCTTEANWADYLWDLQLSRATV